MKGTGAKRNVCPDSCVSTGAKFPVAPVESAPMIASRVWRLLCKNAVNRGFFSNVNKPISNVTN